MYSFLVMFLITVGAIAVLVGGARLERRRRVSGALLIAGGIALAYGGCQVQRSERYAWEAVKGATRISRIRGFLARFPDGAHSPDASNRIGTILREGATKRAALRRQVNTKDASTKYGLKIVSLLESYDSLTKPNRLGYTLTLDGTWPEFHRGYESPFRARIRSAIEDFSDAIGVELIEMSTSETESVGGPRMRCQFGGNNSGLYGDEKTVQRWSKPSNLRQGESVKWVPGLAVHVNCHFAPDMGQTPTVEASWADGPESRLGSSELATSAQDKVMKQIRDDLASDYIARYEWTP